MRLSRLQRILKQINLRESWVIFFVLGNIMINFPFIKIFNQPTTFWGFPLSYLYFTIGWAISIGVIYLFVVASDAENNGQQSNTDRPEQ